MNILIAITIVLIVVFGFSFIAYESDAKPTQIFSEDVQNLAKSLVTTFPDGATIKFALDPQPPITEYIWKEVEVDVVKEIVNDDGTIENVTVKEKVKVKVESSGTLKTTAKGKKICKIGYSCPIEGNILLVNDVGERVTPPYGYFLEVGCEKEMWCDNSRTVMVNEMTDSNGGFRYNWQTSQTWDHVGDYEATVHVRSGYKVNGESFTYDVIPLQIELVE